MRPFFALSILLCASGALVACNQNGSQATSERQDPATPATATTADTANADSSHTDSDAHAEQMQALLSELGSDDAPDAPMAQPIITADGKVQIDWAQVDTGVTPVNPKGYPYPFALDSQPVQNYAKSYHITPEQAQHSMMLSMASPEALGKVVDQLTGKYLGHELTDGADMSLVIHTTPDVVGERHDYVIADKFGEGLVLPVVIRPKDK